MTTKWNPPNLPPWYDRIPKATLFVIARQLAAVVEGSCDDLTIGVDGILNEWWAQYEAGNVPQKPPVEQPLHRPAGSNEPVGYVRCGRSGAVHPAGTCPTENR